MNKREAIRGMLDGKKIKHSSFSKGGYVCMDDNCLIRDDENDIWEISEMFIDGYSIYQERPKSESWAKYRVYNKDEDHWVEPSQLRKSLACFKDTYYMGNYSHHHEIEGSRIDLPVVED